MHAFVALEGLLITVLPSARKQHNSGYKHKAHVRSYYQQFEEQQTQSLIDQRIKEHLGQAAAFQQVGGAYNHLMGQRPNLPPVLPPPRFPIPGGQPLMPGFRPLMPRPLPIPGAPGSLSSPAIKSRSRCPLQEQFLQRKSSRENVLKMVTDVVDKNIVAVSLLSFVAIPIEITGELKVRIVVTGWRFSDGSHILTNLDANPQKSLKGSSNLLSKTVRKLKITVVEAKDLAASDIFGKFDPYVKYQYGKVRGTGSFSFDRTSAMVGSLIHWDFYLRGQTSTTM